jgi:hypothetical protein
MSKTRMVCCLTDNRRTVNPSILFHGLNFIAVARRRPSFFEPAPPGQFPRRVRRALRWSSRFSVCPDKLKLELQPAPFVSRHNSRPRVLDCGGKRSATPLSPARAGWNSQCASSARKRCRRSALPPQSKTLRVGPAFRSARQRLGVRRPAAAFFQPLSGPSRFENASSRAAPAAL